MKLSTLTKQPQLFPEESLRALLSITIYLYAEES